MLSVLVSVAVRLPLMLFELVDVMELVELAPQPPTTIVSPSRVAKITLFVCYSFED